MFKKLVFLASVALFAGFLPAQSIQKEGDITMLVMPCEEIPLQIGQDISRRYPVLLIGYQTVRGQLVLHAWDGENWQGVSTRDYANGTFFSRPPKHAILIESDQEKIPPALIPSAVWCESANCLTSTDPRVLLDLLGQHFDFPFRHWEQFAKRYNYALEEINPTLHNVHWWNLQGDVFLDKLAKRDFSANVNDWYTLETKPVAGTPVSIAQEKTTPAAVPAPVEAQPVDTGATAVEITAKAPENSPEEIKPEQAPVEKPTEIPTIEPVPFMEVTPETDSDVIDVDPFSTEEIPAAEIIIPKK